MSMKRAQLKLFRQHKLFFGGSRLKGNPSRARPFSKKCVCHIVLKSRHAVGDKSFLSRRNKNFVEGIIKNSSKRFYVTVRRFTNVGNHLHIVLQSPTADAQRNFLRTISALIARRVTNSHRGSPMKVEKFWDARPFSRLVPWGKAYQAILNYLSLNSLEAIGFSKGEARDYLKTLSTA